MEVQPTAVNGNHVPSDKPFRIVSSELYYFGYDDNANIRSRLIVKEKDGKHVREYDIEDGANYYCVGCFKKSGTKKFAYIDDNQFLLAPTQHVCDVILLEESEFDQEMKKTMFLQSQNQPRSSMSLYTSSAVGNNSFANTSASSSKTATPVNIIKQSQPPPEIIFDGTRQVNKFSAALLDMSTCSSPEYIPETSPSTSSPSTPINYQPLMPNAITSALPSSPLIQSQSMSCDTTLEPTNQTPTPLNDVETYNTTETPFEILQVQKSDKERKCAETPDSVYGHYLFNGFAANQKAIKSDQTEMKDAATTPQQGSTNLNDTLTVDVSFASQCDDDHVPIPPEDYQYGYSLRTGSANKRVIVFEPDDRTKVRQYAGNGSYFWFCIDCFRIKKKKYKAFFEGETFMAAKHHFSVVISEKIQSITELGQESDTESNGPSRASKRIRIVKEREDATPEIYEEEKTSRVLPDYTFFNSLEKRPVKPEDYQYGVGFKNQTDGRIIVFEENNRNYVREYSYDHKNTWYCRYCLRGNKKLYAFLKDSIFYVPPSHNCQPKLYTAVMREQQEIRARYTVANPNQNLLSPGNCLSNVAPVKPFIAGTVSAEHSPSSSARSSRQRSNNSQSSNVPIKSSAINSLPIASVEVSAKPITEQELRQQRQRIQSKSSSSKYVISEIPKSTFIPVFSNNSQPTSAQSTSAKYREVDSYDFHYGFNEHGDLRKRLIVYEIDRRFVREYNSTETDRWKCINCKYGVARKDDEKFVVTVKHECAPIVAIKSRELQAKYKAIAEMKVKTGNGRVTSSTTNTSHSVERPEAASRSSNDDNVNFNLRDKRRPSSTSNNAITSSLREVNLNDWKYGFDTAGEIEKRVIVFEPNTNHVYVREYRNDGTDTRCLGCAKKGRVQAKWVENRLFVPYPDAHSCKPRLYEEVQNRQKNNESKLGKKRERSQDRSLRSKRTRIAAEDTDTSNSPTTGEYDEGYNVVETSEILKPKKSAITEKVQETIAPSSIATMKVKKYAPSNDSTIVNYYNPSAFFLSECCKKLCIKYTSTAYQFWSNNECEQVSSLSRPYKTFPTSEEMYHGFSCFSLYLTGNESNSSLIREMTNRYIYNNFKSLGKCMGHDFSEFNHETPIIRETLFSFSLTEIHLECLSRWFDCRIGIFNNGKWTRYGNWDDEDCDVLTFLMQIKDGKYDPILSLTV
uniref:Uncharacterized protein n=1 Tax=Panagrolaimus superbus TaxID=310955 RepID=A0A914XW85_9BILA